MHHIGLDYHFRTSSLHMLNGDGKLVKSHKLKGGWSDVVAAVRQWTAEVNDPVTVCYEASCGYGHLYDQLQNVATRVTVAHPGNLRLIFQSKRKHDRVDAQKLAMLSLMNQVPKVHVPVEDVRGWRRFIEHRHRVVAERVRAKNKLRALLRTHGLSAPAGKRLWSVKGLAWLEGLELPGEVDTIMRDMAVEDVRSCDKKIKRVEQHLHTISSKHPGVALLRTIPGVGPRTAEATVAYIDQPGRFTRNKCIGAYFGLVPCEDSSAAKHRLGHITKEGPATVRKLLVEAAWQAIRRSPAVKTRFERIAAGKDDRKKIALVSTAHYLARVMLAMLRSGETWREETEVKAVQ